MYYPHGAFYARTSQRFSETRIATEFVRLARRRYTWPMFISTRNSRIGLALFIVYSLFYSGFVLLAAFSPDTMELTPLAGVNLAIWYGFGLIIAAIVLALIYGWACRANAATGTDDRPTREGQP
jgi:uncharacterized membrane protein (DUF485 family)